MGGGGGICINIYFFYHTQKLEHNNWSGKCGNGAKRSEIWNLGIEAPKIWNQGIEAQKIWNQGIEAQKIWDMATTDSSPHSEYQKTRDRWTIYELYFPQHIFLANHITCSPRARGVLFTLSRPKGLRVGPRVEKCAEFRNPFLKKIPTELFSQIEVKQVYPLFKISHTNLTP